MSDAGGLVEDGELAKPSRDGSAHRVVRSRYRGRDYFLRRVLLIADMLGLWLAMGVAMAISGGRSATFADSLWILPTLPLWAFLFRSYGLYRRPIRRFEPTYLDDMSSLFHALVIGALGLWLFYKVMPPPQLSFEEVLIFGMLALPLIATLRAAARVVNLRIQGPERVFVIAPFEDVRVLGRKLRNHPEYEMELVGAVTGEGASEELDLPLSAGLDAIEPLLASHQIDHLVVQPQFERWRIETDLCHFHPIAGLGAEPFRLLLHLHHQLRAVDSFGKAGIILDNAGGRQQSARLLTR